LKYNLVHFSIQPVNTQVGIINGRDFIDATVRARLENGIFINGGSGIDNLEDFPEQQGFVRGFNNPGSGWVFEPIVNEADEIVGTKISYIIHCDLRGWFFPFVINSAIGGSYTAFFEDLQEELRSKYSS